MTVRCCESLREEPSKERISKDKSLGGDKLVLFRNRMVCTRLEHTQEELGCFVDPGGQCGF